MFQFLAIATGRRNLFWVRSILRDVNLRLLAAVPLLVVAVLAGSVQSGASAAVPVLGSPGYDAPDGEGWGSAHPHHVFNGGDPAGDVSKIHWTHWGGATSVGRGLIPIFRPGGGYYARPGRIVLRAQRLGTCADGTYGYTGLYFRVAHRPGGPVGKQWHPWSGDLDICAGPH